MKKSHTDNNLRLVYRSSLHGLSGVAEVTRPSFWTGVSGQLASSRWLGRFAMRMALITLFACCLPVLDGVGATTANPPLFGMPGDEEDDADEIRFQTVSRLTLSFAPDGTPISRFESTLYASFADLLTAEELESLVLEAFQTWAQHSAVNVGLVSDSGDEFGVAGQSQGDPRFGDIRVGAVPMAGDVFAVAVPNLDFVSGTWSGDLLFNSNAVFADANQFFAVALHEAGHVLGLGHTDDPTSAMHPTALTGQLNTTDIADLKLLYGERIDLDQFDRSDDDGDGGNDSMDDAEEIRNNGSINGMIPLVVYGDIEDQADVDYFKVEPNSGYDGQLTFRLFSRTVSLLQARITVTNQFGQVLGSLAETSDRGSDISVSLPSVSADNEYFVKVESVGMLPNQFGSYSLITTFDDNLLFGSEWVEMAARQNYGDLDQGDIQDLFLTDLASPIADDLHTNDTPATATMLLPRDNIALHSAYRIQASIADATDIDFYQVQALDSVMSVRVNAIFNAVENFGLISDLLVLNSSLEPVAGSVKVNGNGELLIEYGDLVIGADYIVAVVADRPNGNFSTGNYDLNIAYSGLGREFELLGTGRLGRREPTQVHTLYVARSQLFHFALAGPHFLPGSESATIWMSIYDEQGQLKYRTATRQSEIRSSKSVVLTPGGYSVRVHLANPNTSSTAVGTPSGQLAAIMRFRSTRYQIYGIGLSEPTGPEIIDPSQDPFAPCDKMSSDFCYPNNRFSPDPFIFVEPDEVPLPANVPNPPWQDVNIWYWFG